MSRQVDRQQTSSARPAAVEVSELRKTFRRQDGTAIRAICDASFQVQNGEMLVLLGPSGCGKTTLLRCIAGLEKADSGTIRIDGHPTGEGKRTVPPERRSIGMMFQSYALWPHMTVRENVEYPLRSQRFQKEQIADEVKRTLEIMQVADLAGQYPSHLSGGQQQRVALARSLVARPKVILFDEPLSNVDAKVREELRGEIRRRQQEFGFAGVYVTHDQEEALKMATYLAVLREGQIEQLAPPSQVYRRPASRYVAEFVGKTNCWEIQSIKPSLESSNQRACVTTRELGSLWVSKNTAHELGARVHEGSYVTLRPEAIHVSRTPLHSENEWRGSVTDAVFSGARMEYMLRLDSGATILVWASSTHEQPLEVNDRAFVQIHEDTVWAVA